MSTGTPVQPDAGSSTAKPGAAVIPLRSAAGRSIDRKWGSAVVKIGFCVVPSLLLRAQQRLGLNPTQLAVLLQLADYWWEKDRKPYPSKEALSDRLGLSERQVQRYTAELEQAGFIRRIERRAPHGGKLSNEYDLSGLVDKLKQLEPDFRQVKEMKRQVARRGGLRAKGLPPS